MTDVAPQRSSLVPPAQPAAGAEPAVAPSSEWRGSADIGAYTPFYETAPNPDARRRMLLVFFYFAPSAEVGALRWLQLARFGAERGWAVDVVALHPSFMGTLDTTRLTQLPPGVRLFGFSGTEPIWYRGLVQVWRRARRNGPARGTGSGMGGHLDGSDLTVGFPGDTAPAWRRAFRSRMHFRLADQLSRRATEVGMTLARLNAYDAIVSSGPPHASHDAARAIAAEARVPFVMDMRDPWSDDSAMPEEMRSDAWQRQSLAHEQRCVSSAELVIVTSKAHEQLQVRKFPALSGRVSTVMNGADTDPLPASRVGDRFLVAFAGMIYLGRNPRALFRAAARVARETGASPGEFGVEFMGDDSCEGIPLATIAADEGLEEHFRAHGFRPRREALDLLAGASLLVSLPLRTRMTLPAKLFEYTRFDAWLLVLAEEGSATAELLRGTGADVVDPDDEGAMARVLRTRFDEFRAGKRPLALNRDGRFDRAKQSAHLFDLLDGVAEKNRAARAR